MRLRALRVSGDKATLMNVKLKKILGTPAVKGTVAALVGYVVLALASTLVQGVWLGGVTYHASSVRVLTLAAIFTPACGLLAGWVAAKIGGRSGMAAAIGIAILVALETTYLYITRRVDGPLWFEAGAGVALAAAVLMGAWLGVSPRLRHRRG